VKIIIATTFEPFLSGGDTVIVDSLEEMLIRAGHEVETFRFPTPVWSAVSPRTRRTLRRLAHPE
jgi:hypothetical protein